MKKIVSVVLLFLPSFLFAQTNGNTNNNQKNTDYYNSHPYDSNPYLNSNQQNNSNFFEKDAQNADNKNGDNKSGDSKGNTNQNKNTNDPNFKNQELNFQDLNALKNQYQENQVQESYKNDPDYLNYLNASRSEIDKKKDSIREEKDSIKLFGSNFFSNNIFDLNEKTLTSPPLDYRLGPGDELIVNIWGASELQQNYTIGKDGSIFPKIVGKIFLQGMTFEQATRTISSRFRKIVASNSRIDVQMGKARTIKVTIVGEVKKQGTITISAFNTAYNALSKAGGVTNIGNLRKIEIKRNGRTVDILDLYKYLIKGGEREDQYLEDNDMIYVGLYEKKVKAAGNFKRPMIYELTGDETLTDLVDLAGGTASRARSSLLHIKTIKDEKEMYIDIPLTGIDNDGETFRDLVLNDGDIVTLSEINEGLKNIVHIEGAVNYPDDYMVKEGDRMLDVIGRAGGINNTAYLPKAFIFRGSNSLESAAIKIDIKNLSATDLVNNVPIFSGDRIKILSNKDFEQEYKIEVVGYVRKPGKVPYYKNMKLKDVLLLTGGLRLDAENGRIEISNIVDSLDKYNINSKGSNIKIVSINSNLEVDKISENIVLKPMDRIYVRKKKEFLTQEKVTIFGQVGYPGEYVLVEENQRISSLIKQCGGILSTAYTEGAKLIRAKSGAIVIDLPDAIAHPGKEQDLVLRDSDIIIVPLSNEIVSVRGEIQSPINIKFDKASNDVKFYIGAAGGFGDRPWKSRINVKYQNGRIKNTKNFLFFHFYPKVKEGSVVNVPTKPKRENNTKLTDVITYTTSALSTLATLFILFKTL